MRSAKFWIPVTIAVAFAAVALFVVRELDMERQEKRIADLATALTGRQVEVRGGLGLGFSMRPTLVAKDVRVANASWGSQPTMLTAERVDVSLALFPLFFGVVELLSVKLSGVHLLLETDAAGRRNWDLGFDERAGDAAESEFGWSLEKVLVEDLVLEIGGPGSGVSDPIVVSRIALAADDSTKLLRMELSARPDGVEFEAIGSVGSLEDWFSGGQVPFALDFRWGDSEFKTDATLDLGKRPRLRGRVVSGTVEIEDWLAAGSEKPDERAQRSGLFPTSPLGLGAVGSSNFDISLAVGSIVDERARLELTHAEASLKGGVLRFESVQGVLSDAAIGGSLEIDARAKVPRIRLDFTARDLDFGDLLGRLQLTDEVDAVIDARVELRGSGDSVAAILGNLDGNVAVAVSHGEIPTGYVDRLVSDLSALIMPWARPPKRVEIVCAIAEFTIERGVARSQALMFDTERLTLRGAGEVDLANETLRLRLAPRPRNHRLLSLATDLTLTGPLSRPQAFPSPIGLVGSAARLALKPVRLLTPLVGAGATRHLAPLVGDDAAREQACNDRAQVLVSERRDSD